MQRDFQSVGSAVELLRTDVEEVQEQHQDLERRVEEYFADSMAGSRDHRRIRFTGDVLHQFWVQRGAEDTRALLLSWYASYRQSAAQQGEGDVSASLQRAMLYTMPRARGNPNVAHWVVVELEAPGFRNHLCHVLFHAPARAQDTTWRTTKPQASLTPYQRDMRNYVYLHFAEDPRPDQPGPSRNTGVIPWPDSGPAWHPGRQVILYGDEACVKTNGQPRVTISLSLGEEAARKLIERALNLAPTGPFPARRTGPLPPPPQRVAQ